MPLRVIVRSALVAVAVLLGTDGVAWFYTTQRMLAALAPWQEAARSRGVLVQWGPPKRGGWPFRARLLLPAVTADAGLAMWQAGSVVLSLSPLQPGTLGLDVRGPQSVRAGGWPPAAVAARALTAEIGLESGQVTVDGAGLAITGDWGAATIGTVTARTDGAALALDAEHLALPQAGLPFGGAAERASLRVHAVGAPFAMPAEGAPDGRAAAAAWAAAQGALVLDDAALRWGALDAEGHGRLSLDANLQPLASGTVRLRHYREAVETLRRTGTISGNAARVVTTVLDLMAGPQAGEAPEVEAPLRWQDGVVSMGAIPLARTLPLAWP